MRYLHSKMATKIKATNLATEPLLLERCSALLTTQFFSEHGVAISTLLNSSLSNPVSCVVVQNFRFTKIIN